MFDFKKASELLEQLKIEQKELAKEIGVSEAMMSFIIRGLREPSLATLSRLAHRLGVSVADLITEDGPSA